MAWYMRTSWVPLSDFPSRVVRRSFQIARIADEQLRLRLVKTRTSGSARRSGGNKHQVDGADVHLHQAVQIKPCIGHGARHLFLQLAAAFSVKVNAMMPPGGTPSDSKPTMR